MITVSNSQLHWNLISEARNLPVASTKRLHLIHFALQGLIRCKNGKYATEEYLLHSL
jgi:hypothetical protein